MAIKRQHFIYHPDTGDRLEIRAVNQLKPDQVLLGTGGDLTFGSNFYWEWDTLISSTFGNERLFFDLRDSLKHGDMTLQLQAIKVLQA